MPEQWISIYQTYEPAVYVALHISLSIITSLHILYSKRYRASAVGWLGVVWLSPLLGVAIYWVLGINRIYRDNIAKRSENTLPSTIAEAPSRHRLQDFAKEVTGLAITHGNEVTPMAQPAQTFEKMLRSIENAQKSITLCTYIFDYDNIGKRFVQALSQAHQRGVNIRVLIDAVGAKYSKTSTVRKLEKHGIRVKRFLPTLLPWKMSYINLRNHRKIMVVDGEIAFVGGTNIRSDRKASDERIDMQDIHFHIQGPVVSQIQKTFIDDWMFASKEKLELHEWAAPSLESKGSVSCRNIQDGPDEDYDSLRSIFVCALATAKKRIRIVTPYFLPDITIMDLLYVAAASNVNVQIVVPQVGNLRFVQWASMVPLSDLATQGVEVYLTKPPFDHSKLFTIDDDISLIGSANWDNRSFKLNFENNLECYDEDLTNNINQIMDEKIKNATRLEPHYYRSKSHAVYLRDLLAYLTREYL